MSKRANCGDDVGVFKPGQGCFISAPWQSLNLARAAARASTWTSHDAATGVIFSHLGPAAAKTAAMATVLQTHNITQELPSAAPSFCKCYMGCVHRADGPLATCHPPWALSCAICHMQPRQAMAVAIDGRSSYCEYCKWSHCDCGCWACLRDEPSEDEPSEVIIFRSFLEEEYLLLLEYLPAPTPLTPVLRFCLEHFVTCRFDVFDFGTRTCLPV